MGLWLAIAFALAFALTNGFLDSASATATLVATRAARPLQAIVLAAVFNMLGAVVVGTTVAATIAGIVSVPPSRAVAVVGSGVLAATTWGLLAWWRKIPSSSGHALVGGLVGAAFAETGSGAVRLGGLDGWKPVGVLGVLIALAVSPVVGFVLGVGLSRLAQRALRRATHRVRGPIRAASWAMSAALAFSHGSNDGQKAMGAIAVVLLGTGHTEALSVPLWARLACGVALTAGTAMGGWRIVRTVGRGIFHLAPLDGFVAQSAATAVILVSSYGGAPVSATQVVASSVVGVGGGRRRWRHVRWAVVRSMGFAWLLTLPATIALGATTLALWSVVD